MKHDIREQRNKTVLFNTIIRIEVTEKILFYVK